MSFGFLTPPPFADPDATTAAFRDSLQLQSRCLLTALVDRKNPRHAGVCHTLARRDCKCGWKQSETKEDEEKERVKKNWDDEEEYIRRKKTIFARDLSRSSEDADKQKYLPSLSGSRPAPSRLSHSRSISERMYSKVDCTVPVEHVERVGVTRHGLADELGTADHGERHSEGGQATKDGAGSGGGWREELLLGDEKVGRARAEHGERRTRLHSIFSRRMLLFRVMQKGGNGTMRILDFCGWKRKVRSCVGESVLREKKGGREVEMAEHESEGVKRAMGVTTLRIILSFLFLCCFG
ncbi:hypothetical protein BLNAU_24823 [Blattamonas nauphoetae]|uniref:Uncharacterized protein n=1 Tax=Blattamonas nauphoetae TaxID=2049346 RepID=A0ABQ9WLR0_9EUKA|nr:hypothetical protein BLNAU_24823 [Blattamonas nauphoetae]